MLLPRLQYGWCSDEQSANNSESSIFLLIIYDCYSESNNIVLLFE